MCVRAGGAKSGRNEIRRSHAAEGYEEERERGGGERKDTTLCLSHDLYRIWLNE